MGSAMSRSAYVSVYGQDIQDGCPLALCTSPALPVPASPTPTHTTDLPTDLPQALANDRSNLRSEHLCEDSLSKGC